jgi:hypothetical protein
MFQIWATAMGILSFFPQPKPVARPIEQEQIRGFGKRILLPCSSKDFLALLAISG